MVKKITVPEIELSHWIGPNKSSRQILKLPECDLPRTDCSRVNHCWTDTQTEGSAETDRSCTFSKQPTSKAGKPSQHTSSLRHAATTWAVGNF